MTLAGPVLRFPRRTLTLVLTGIIFLSLFRWIPGQPIPRPSWPSSDEVLNDPRWTHQRKSVLPRSHLSHLQCDAIGKQDLQKLTSPNAHEGAPYYAHYRSGKLVAEENAAHAVGSEFCTVIFVPQSSATQQQVSFHNRAIEGWGPDSLHLEIHSDDIRLIPQHPDYWGLLSESSDGSYAVYMLAHQLNHPGRYNITGEVEFQNYDWVMEDPLDFIHGDQHNYTMTDIQLEAASPLLDISGKPVPRPMQQCYRNGYNNLQGRWYRASSFGIDGNQTSLNPTAEVGFANHNTTTDDWGWTFAPDACSLNFFDKPDISACLRDRTLQILGESNSRRLLKTLVSGGSWCTDFSDKVCQCEDQFEDEIPDMDLSRLNVTRFHETNIRDTPTHFGNNSSVFFDFAGGLLNRKLWNPWFFFYHPASAADDSTIVSRRVDQYGPIDLVHVSLLTWDIAGVPTADELHDFLPELRSRLLAAYPPGTRFITRLANNMCCLNQNYKTRFSAPRFAIFNAMWRSFWAEDEKAGAMLVDDATVLQGRRDAETAFFCPTTHLRASHVRLEAMMWLNAVCDGGDDGRSSKGSEAGSSPEDSKMRDWGFSKREVKRAKAEVDAALGHR